MTSKASNRWTASWIWGNDTLGAAQRQVIAARKQVSLEAVPHAAPSRIFADALYVLHVNCAEVRRGPGRASPRSRRYDEIDLAPFLRSGENVITIIAAINATASRNWMPAPTMVSELGGGALVFEADLGLDQLVATDDTWSTTTIPGWSLSSPTGIVSQRGLELIDLGAIPTDLHDPDADLSGWKPARVKSGRGMGDRESIKPPSYPFGPTQASVLAPPTVTTRTLELVGDRWMLPDIGAGTLIFDIEGDGGEAIEVTTFEVIESDGSIRDFHESIGLELVAPQGRRTAESLDMFGLRGLTITAPDTVTVHGVQLNERCYPVAGNARFACSDPFFDQLYRAGRRTVTLCSNDAYVDNPTREGRAWTGDAVVHQMVDFASNADWSLACWNPKLGGYSTTPDGMVPGAVAGDGEFGQFGVISDWSLHWVHSVWNIQRFTGDVEKVADLLPEAERIVRWFDQFDNQATGLPTDVYGWALIDWAWVPTNGASSVLIALLGRACRDLAEMSEFVGDGGRADRARRRHAQLRAAFELFWDPQRRRYADTLVDGERGPTASVHAQAAAVAAGFVPDDRHERIVELLSDTSNHVHATLSHPEGDPGMDGGSVLPGAEMMLPSLPEPWWDTETQMVMAQPFFRYVVHDALAELGRSDLIIESMRDWSHLLDRCGTSLGETFWSGSLAQGWSSTPVRDLVSRIVGITPVEPGYTVVGVDPALGPLEWAEATVPTPLGEVTVRVDADTIVVDSPAPLVVEGEKLAAGSHTIRRRTAS